MRSASVGQQCVDGIGQGGQSTRQASTAFGGRPAAGAVVTWTLVAINVVLLALNLIPAYPLDGGRIAKAIAWRVTGDRNRGTRASARLSQGFAYLAVATGISLALAHSHAMRPAILMTAPIPAMTRAATAEVGPFYQIAIVHRPRARHHHRQGGSDDESAGKPRQNASDGRQHVA